MWDYGGVELHGVKWRREGKDRTRRSGIWMEGSGIWVERVERKAGVK